MRFNDFADCDLKSFESKFLVKIPTLLQFCCVLFKKCIYAILEKKGLNMHTVNEYQKELTQVQKYLAIEMLNIVENNQLRIEYNELAEILKKQYNIDINPHTQIPLLIGDISEFCHYKYNLPMLSCVVVNKETQLPGIGFYKLYDKLHNTNYAGNKYFEKKCRDKVKKDIINCKEWYKLYDYLNNKDENEDNQSYEQLSIEYLKKHGKSTIDDIFDFITSRKETGPTGKRYLKEVITNRYQGSDTFVYDGLFVSLKGIAEEPEITSNIELYEGILQETTIMQKKRNQEIIKLVKERDNYTCQVCGFYYNNKIVEAHHLTPISSKDEEYKVTLEHLVTLCPNCHALAHILLSNNDKYQNRKILIDSLKEINSKTLRLM